MPKVNNYINRFKTGFKLANDWRYTDKKITLGKKTVSRNQMHSIVSQLDLRTKQLTQKKIEDWRLQNQYAMDVENPKRYGLYSIYDDAMHDLHLKGAVRNRKMAVLGKPFKLVNDKGEINHDATKLFRKAWFRKTLSLAIDSKFYGHSLIELTGIDRTGELRFRDVTLIPRHHVCPEYSVILVDPMDDPKNGIPYLEGDLTNTCISVGEKFDLGELNSVSKETISKKYVLQFWDTFAEIFGMPLRVGKTSSRDPKDIAKVEDMLESMGSAAWGLFPEGTSLEIIGSKQGDSFNVYDKRIERANSEMSKGILGQTMTMDNGSSLSQAKVHEDVADEISDDDSTFINDLVNDDILPFCLKHGWPINGLRFEWDDTYEYTPQEMKEIEAMLLNHFDIAPEYFVEKYGVTITGTKQSNTLPAEGETKEKDKKKSLVHLSNSTLPSWVTNMPPE